MNKRALWALVAVLALVVAACSPSDDAADTTEAAPDTTEAAPATTEAPAATTTTEEAMAELGSPERPVQVLFVPSVDTDIIVSGGEIMREALEEATGLSFEVKVPTSYAATIEEMCASPEDTMGFIPGFGYVIASQLCGVDVAFSAVRFGWGVYWAQFLVPRDSDIASVEDLAGLKWARPDATSTSGSLYPQIMFDELGIEPGEVVDAGGHPQAALALYRGEVDFATTFYSPPLLPEGRWAPGDAPDIPDEFVDSCAPTDEGRVFCGPDDAYRVLDARASAVGDAEDIIQEVKILDLTPPIPNDTLSFGPDFPADLRTQIEEALVAFAAKCDDDQEGDDCAWDQSIGHQDFYNWTSISAALDADYDPLRQVVEFAGISLEDL